MSWLPHLHSVGLQPSLARLRPRMAAERDVGVARGIARAENVDEGRRRVGRAAYLRRGSVAFRTFRRLRGPLRLRHGLVPHSPRLSCNVLTRDRLGSFTLRYMWPVRDAQKGKKYCFDLVARKYCLGLNGNPPILGGAEDAPGRSGPLRAPITVL